MVWVRFDELLVIDFLIKPLKCVRIHIVLADKFDREEAEKRANRR